MRWTEWRMRTWAASGAVVILGLLTAQDASVVAQAPAGARSLRVTALSTRADLVSGGNVLVEVTVPAGGSGSRVAATLNGTDVSSAFRGTGAPQTFRALLTGLVNGVNTLVVDGRYWGAASQTLELVNYPSTGPIISGPQIQPFICQTDSFQLPDGTTLGPALDAHCSAATRVQYVYLPKGGTELVAMPGTRVPDDVAMTTTIAGATVPYVVRVETGTMNRGVYQNAVLHNPAVDPPPTPFSPPPAWNTRLIAVHGSGCTGGWYRQGAALGVSPLTRVNVTRLGEGYAIFTNTLNHPSNSCNPIVAGESTMMGKEHFIETFGPPAFTISMGGSGGAYTSLQVGDAFPGLFDGVIITSTFPDALSLAMSGLEAHLLRQYFLGAGNGLTEAQKVAVSGYSGMRAFEDAANQARRTDPVPGRTGVPGYTSAAWNEVVPASVRYDPRTSPRGARPTVFDVSRNVYGVDPATGAALRPFDNVGVQYGLAALEAGVITPAQFLDLNDRIGGFDRDVNHTPARSVGDAGAIERAYRSGVHLSGGGGLASIPVFDAGGYNDTSGYHYQWFHFAVRERMRLVNGRADNHLLWRGRVPADQSWDVITRWVAAIAADRSARTAVEKMAANRPAEAVDGCFVDDTFVAESQTLSREPTSTCNRALPSWTSVRHAAGGPLSGYTLKCQLTPIDPREYGVTFSAAEMERLRRIFPNGVCDWGKPGAGESRLVTWPSFGPSPHNLVFDVTRQPAGTGN
jgi:hypothetical protein